MAIAATGNEAATYSVWWLVLYVGINLFVTILNKMILKTLNLPYPEVLVLWHYSCSALGSYFMVHVFKYIKPAQLDFESHKKLFLFSVLFNVNILISTVSLNMVSMSLHQILRALSPAFTVLITFLWLGKRYARDILLSLVVIFVGVSLYAWRGEVDYTLIGLIVTLLGAFLAALKGVVVNRFMVGSLKLHPFDLLQHMSFYAACQMGAYLLFDGSLVSVIAHLGETATSQTIMVLLVNGLCAFLLNIVSFMANKKTSPLMMNIGGITKQVLAIILGIVIFHRPVTSMSAFGVLVTIAGIAWYTTVNFRIKQQGQKNKTILIGASPPVPEVIHHHDYPNLSLKQ